MRAAVMEGIRLPLVAPSPPTRTVGGSSPARPGFYDPSSYAEGREVTVVGDLHGDRTQKVGEFEYRYPVVAAQAVHLWEERRQPRMQPGVGISIGGVFGGW